MTKVTLISSDGARFEIDEVVAKKSQLLKNMIEGIFKIYLDTGTEEDIFIPNVKKNTLERVIKYCDHYRSS